MIEVILTADRVTKGAVRFVDKSVEDFPMNIYLRKTQCAELGIEPVIGAQITLAITPLAALQPAA